MARRQLRLNGGLCACNPHRYYHTRLPVIMLSLLRYVRAIGRWHIDGCPGDFIKGVTDHYGEIHNFDVLVGVLLNRVDNPMYVRTSGGIPAYAGMGCSFSVSCGSLSLIPTVETVAP